MTDVARVFRYYADLADKEAGRLVDTNDPNALSRIVYEPVGVCGAHRAVELPAPPDELEDRAGPRGRQHGRHEAGPLHAAVDDPPDPPARGGRRRRRASSTSSSAPARGSARRWPTARTSTSISLTGGLEAGRALLRGAAVNVKKVALELGGKSPNIVFADADFETAVDNALTAAFVHSGQVCSAGCRAIVEDAIYDALRRRRSGAAPTGSAWAIGTDDATETGALISADHRDKVEGYVASAIAEGARLVAGGRRPGRARAPGRLLLPPDRLRRRQPRHADRPRGGLRAGPDGRAVHDRGRGDRARQRHDLRPGRRGLDRRRGPGPAGRRAGCATARSGSTTTTPTCRRPSGAASSSPAIGRELGPSGLDEYREAKHIWQNTAPAPTGWFAGWVDGRE